MTTFPIKTTNSDADQAIETMVLAFGADPAARWLYPEPEQYRVHFPSFVKTFAGKAFEHGSAYSIDGYSGAAFWLPPEIHPDEQSLMELLRRTVSTRDMADVTTVFELMNRYHPPEPHWYLPMIGVRPSQQGKGYGSALLKHGLDACDRDQKLAYLESSSPTNIALYERHGFELLGVIQAGMSPPIFPMVRKSVLRIEQNPSTMVPVTERSGSGRICTAANLKPDGKRKSR